MRRRLVILQDVVMPYRRAFYNRLAEDFDVWVIHSGDPSIRPDDSYRELIVPMRKFGPFRLQRPGKAIARLAPVAAVLAIFDLRWPLTLWAAWRARGAIRLLWGHRQSRHAAVNRVRLLLLRHFDAAVQYGEEDIPAMLAGGVCRERIFVAPNTIDVPNHCDTSGSAKSSLLYVGRLQARKRLPELFDAFAALAPAIDPGVRIEIVGAGEIRPELEAAAAAANIADRVIFHGAITDAEKLKPIFARALAYVSPDNVGLGVLHAFAYGVPVVTGAPRPASRAGFRHGPEFQNIRHGENGLIFEDQAGFREALTKILGDTSFARRLGQNAYRDYIGNRSIDAMAIGIHSAVERARQLGRVD